MTAQNTSFISCTQANYHCKILGNGPQKIIAFHGFGQDGGVFRVLQSQNPNLTIYAIDLPFHGETQVHDPNTVFRTSDVEELIQKLVDQQQLSDFSIIAFSIGARFAFPVITRFGNRITGIWLLAPDGIGRNLWFDIATSTSFGRLLFSWTLVVRKSLVSLANTLGTLGVLPKQTAQIVKNSLSTSAKANRVQSTWLSMRKLIFDRPKYNSGTTSNGAKINVVLGSNDTVIKSGPVKNAMNKLEGATIQMIDSSHSNLIHEFARKVSFGKQ